MRPKGLRTATSRSPGRSRRWSPGSPGSRAARSRARRRTTSASPTSGTTGTSQRRTPDPSASGARQPELERAGRRPRLVTGEVERAALAQPRVLLQERLAGNLEAAALFAVVRKEVADAAVADPERHHADRRDLEALPLELAGEP